MCDKKSLYCSLSSLICAFFFCFAAIFALMHCLMGSLLFSLFGVAIGAYSMIKNQGQFFSLQLVFWLFSALYALSTPLNLCFGGKVDSTFAAGNMEENVFPFLVAYALSSLGFFAGCSWVYRFRVQSPLDTSKQTRKKLDLSIIQRGLFFTAILTSFFELVNLIRVGGVNMLFVGKGVYQSAVGDLSLTLPSETIYGICGIFIGLYLSYIKVNNVSNKKIKLFFAFLLLFPFLFCKTLLGQRGALVSALLSGIASYSIYTPIKRIRIKTLVGLLLVYVFLMALYTNRGIVSLLLTNPNEFVSRALDFQRLKENLNPSNSEFGAAFGNFCMFYEKYGTRFDKQYGLTYVKGLLVMIPSFLFPGEKPLAITYVFRDEFFPSWASRSRIASTGFSSILEAYMNGGFLGVFLIYSLIGFLVKKLDMLRNRQGQLLSIMISSILIGTCMDFSRSEFGGLLSTVFWDIVYCIIIYCFITCFGYNNDPYNIKDHELLD